jgi:hypothetical protein
MDETPDAEASAKLAQYLAVVVQVAEAVVRSRQQRASHRADATERGAAAAARASRLLTDATGRHRPRPAAGPAEAAADAAEAWLRQAAPDVMTRYTSLRHDGADRLEAMRNVLTEVTADSAASAGAYAQSRAETAAWDARRREGTPDDPATPTIDEHADGLRAAVPRRDEQVAWQQDAEWLRAGDAALIRRMPGSIQPHPADLAALAFPQPYVRVQPALPAPPQLPALPPAGRTAVRVAQH